MSREDNGTEYVFTLPDGSRRYEIVFEMADFHAFMKLHKAVKGAPLASHF